MQLAGLQYQPYLMLEIDNIHVCAESILFAGSNSTMQPIFHIKFF